MKTFFLTLTLGVLIFPKSLLLAQVVPIQSAIDEVEACIKEFCSLYSINKDFYVVENKDCEISICVYAGRKLLCPQSEKVPLYIKKDPYGKFNKYEVFHKAYPPPTATTISSLSPSVRTCSSNLLRGTISPLRSMAIRLPCNAMCASNCVMFNIASF